MIGITTRTVARQAAMGAIVLALGCAPIDTRLDTLSAGISKDSSLVLMGAEPIRTDPYLYDGQYIEAMYFTPKGPVGSEPPGDRDMWPLVVINGTLTGWGWDYWDSVAVANRIDLPPKEGDGAQ